MRCSQKVATTRDKSALKSPEVGGGLQHDGPSSRRASSSGAASLTLAASACRDSPRPRPTHRIGPWEALTGFLGRPANTAVMGVKPCAEEINGRAALRAARSS